MLGFNETVPEKPEGDSPKRSKTLIELFPDLDLGTCYPSLHDIKPFQYEFCSTPAKDKDSMKQIKSQIYQTDTVSQFLGIINPNPIP